MSAAVKQRRYHCRQKNCTNSYTDVLGGENAFGKNYSGADCIPCFYAALLLEYDLTIQRVEESSQLMGMFKPHLDAMGWTWADVVKSYARRPVVM